MEENTPPLPIVDNDPGIEVNDFQVNHVYSSKLSSIKKSGTKKHLRVETDDLTKIAQKPIVTKFGQSTRNKGLQ